MRYLSICKCPEHGTWMLSVDDEGGGTRITSSKCCGRWDVVKRFPMTAKQLREAAAELECNADQLEQESA